MKLPRRLNRIAYLSIVFLVGVLTAIGVGFVVVAICNAEDNVETPSTTTLEDTTPTPTPTTTSSPMEDSSCWKRDFGFGSFVCVCNATYCDSLPRVTPVPAGQALVFTSTKDALRLDRQELIFSNVINVSSTQTLIVKRKDTYQSVYGFGGGFTDAAGINILSLPEGAQERLLRSYFSEDGLDYNVGRLPIGGTDFSTRAYSYDDNTTADAKLSRFQLQEDDLLYKIPLIHRAKALRKSDDLLLFSSIWSPPKWMKTSDDFSGFGFLKDEYYQSYADYFIKFLEAYQAHNVTVFSVSTGNEPMNGVIPYKYFNSLGWWPKNLGKWIKENFGPTIRKSKFKAIKILTFEDQRILLPWVLDMVLADKAAADFIDIIGFHWYLNFITPSSILDTVHKQFPNKPLVSTEACNGDKPWDFTRVQLGSWTRGEYYISDIIAVMNHWTTAWIDWNLALNKQGGPTWSENWVDSPIIVDAEKGEFYRNPMYYALAHVTKFVPRDSLRIELSSEGGPWLGGKLENVGFLRPDGGIAIILLNKHDSGHNVFIHDEERGQIAFYVPAKSFVSTIYW